MAKIPYKIYLGEDEIPKQWYNVRADMKTQHRPMLNPATHKPVQLADLEPVFCTPSFCLFSKTKGASPKPPIVLQNIPALPGFPSVSADACILSGKSTGYAGKNLLQI